MSMIIMICMAIAYSNCMINDMAIAWQLISQLHYPMAMVHAHGRLPQTGLWPIFFPLHSNVSSHLKSHRFLCPSHTHLYLDSYMFSRSCRIDMGVSLALGHDNMPVQVSIYCWSWHWDGPITIMHSYLLR